MRIFVLAAVGAAGVLGTLAVRYWHLLPVHIHSGRLDEATAYEKAAPALEALTTYLKMPGTADYLVARLGADRPLLTFWLFTYLDIWPEVERAFVESFSRRLERDENLLLCYSRFVRWRLGDDLGTFLDSLSPRVWSLQVNLDLPAGGQTEIRDLGRDGKQLGIRTRAVAWALGLWPLPPAGAGCRQRLADWLYGDVPLLRELVYQERLGRCKRAGERDPTSVSTSYGSRVRPLIPGTPLPGWNRAVPGLPVLATEDPPWATWLIVPGSTASQAETNALRAFSGSRIDTK